MSANTHNTMHEGGMFFAFNEGFGSGDDVFKEGFGENLETVERETEENEDKENEEEEDPSPEFENDYDDPESW